MKIVGPLVFHFAPPGRTADMGIVEGLDNLEDGVGLEETVGIDKDHQLIFGQPCAGGQGVAFALVLREHMDGQPVPYFVVELALAASAAAAGYPCCRRQRGSLEQFFGIVLV